MRVVGPALSHNGCSREKEGRNVSVSLNVLYNQRPFGRAVKLMLIIINNE